MTERQSGYSDAPQVRLKGRTAPRIASLSSTRGCAAAAYYQRPAELPTEVRTNVINPDRAKDMEVLH